MNHQLSRDVRHLIKHFEDMCLIHKLSSEAQQAFAQLITTLNQEIYKDDEPTPSYPVPDPAWAYAGIWDEIWAAKEKSEALIKYLAGIEEATDDHDHNIAEQPEDLQIRLNSAVALLNDR